MPITTDAITLCANPACSRAKRHPGLCTDEIASRTGLTVEQVQTVLDFEITTPHATAARDSLYAFYAAHPDVENADGDQFLALPEALTAELDKLLAAAIAEKSKLAVGNRVRLTVSEYPDPVVGTIRRIYRDAIGAEVAEIDFPSGRDFVQSLEFLTAV